MPIYKYIEKSIVYKLPFKFVNTQNITISLKWMLLKVGKGITISLQATNFEN